MTKEYKINEKEAAGPLSHSTAVLTIILASYLMIVLDISIVITALPKLQLLAGADARHADGTRYDGRWRYRDSQNSGCCRRGRIYGANRGGDLQPRDLGPSGPPSAGRDETALSDARMTKLLH
jgi:hypothetical protein